MSDWIVIPLLAAIIGWFTNYLAVKMIFRPYNPINILGIKVQGLIPKKRKELAEKVGEVVADSLLTEEELKKILSSVNYKKILASKLDEVLTEKLIPNLGKFFPFLSSLPTEVIDKLKNEIISYVEKNVSLNLGKQLSGEIDQEVIRRIIYEKIEGFSVETLEEIILRISKRELKAIEILGGILGFFIGIVQMIVIHWR